MCVQLLGVCNFLTITCDVLRNRIKIFDIGKVLRDAVICVLCSPADQASKRARSPSENITDSSDSVRKKKKKEEKAKNTSDSSKSMFDFDTAYSTVTVYNLFELVWCCQPNHRRKGFKKIYTFAYSTKI